MGTPYPSELCCSSSSQVVCRPELASDPAEACCSGGCVNIPNEFTDPSQPHNLDYQKCCTSADYSVCKTGVGGMGTQDWNYLYSCCSPDKKCVSYPSGVIDPHISQELEFEKCCSADTTAVGHQGSTEGPVDCCGPSSGYPNSYDTGEPYGVLCCDPSHQPAQDSDTDIWLCCAQDQFFTTASGGRVCCPEGQTWNEQTKSCEAVQQSCAHTGADTCGGDCPTPSQTCTAHNDAYGNTDCDCSCGGTPGVCSGVCPVGQTCDANSCSCTSYTCEGTNPSTCSAGTCPPSQTCLRQSWPYPVCYCG